MKTILTSQPLIYFYIITATFILMQFVLRYMIGSGSRPSESLYNFVLFIYGHILGNVIFIFPAYFWYKFTFGVGIVSLLFSLVSLFLIQLFIHIVSNITPLIYLIHFYIRIGFFLIPYLIYLILTFDYNIIPI